MIDARSSAIGIASHTPFTPNNCGSVNKHNKIKKKVLRKEIKADIFPFDKAVNMADEYIFIPENRKLKAKI